MLHKLSTLLRMITRIRAQNLREEVRLFFIMIKHLLDNHNVRLDMIVQVDGIKFRLVDFESLVIVGPLFEEHVLDYLKPAEGDVFLDVGAHIGKYTLRIAETVGVQGKVIAIEPEPGNFSALQEGIEMNGLHNVIALNFAAYDKECDLNLYIGPIGGEVPRGCLIGKAMSSVKRRVSRTAIKVKAKPLDEIIDELGVHNVNWMKVDAEGAEYEILKGSKRILEQCRPKIIAECSMNQTAVFGFLEKLGYDSINISEGYYFFKPSD